MFQHFHRWFWSVARAEDPVKRRLQRSCHGREGTGSRLPAAALDTAGLQPGSHAEGLRAGLLHLIKAEPLAWLLCDFGRSGWTFAATLKLIWYDLEDFPRVITQRCLGKAHLKSLCIPQGPPWEFAREMGQLWHGEGAVLKVGVPVLRAASLWRPHWQMCCFLSISASAASAGPSGCSHTSKEGTLNNMQSTMTYNQRSVVEVHTRAK